METELTSNILKQLLPSKNVYLEIAGEGAMGNAGGILIYGIENDLLKTYQTNKSKNIELYSTIRNQFFKNLNGSMQNKIEINKTQFNYYYGGMGNHVFTNSSFHLNIGDNFFKINHNNKIHKIYPTVQGVFVFFRKIKKIVFGIKLSNLAKVKLASLSNK